MRRRLLAQIFFLHIWTLWAPLKPGMVCSNVIHQKSQLMTSSITYVTRFNLMLGTARTGPARIRQPVNKSLLTTQHLISHHT